MISIYLGNHRNNEWEMIAALAECKKQMRFGDLDSAKNQREKSRKEGALWQEFTVVVTLLDSSKTSANTVVANVS